MCFEFEDFYCPCKTATTKCVGGIVASIAAFQAVDPGSIPGQRISLGSGWSQCGTLFVTSGETFGWVVRLQKITSSPRLGIEPRSSAWQAEILSTILKRSCACRDLPSVEFLLNGKLIEQLWNIERLFPPSFELGNFRVLGEHDNHYTTETCLLAASRNI